MRLITGDRAGFGWWEAYPCIRIGYIHTNLYSAKSRENESEALVRYCTLWPILLGGH